jgi:putative membrane protein
VTTLVLCVDRGGDFDRETPVVGRETVGDLVTAVGVEDPEDSRVNCLLETLRVARDIQDDGDSDDAIVAVVSGTGESVNVDRDIARQVDALVTEHDPQSAVVIVDSADDELAVPIVESRLRVDAVDRVIVRQARDLESTYYLLKQFLSDEELRGTVLVPLGTILLAVPIIVTLTSSITAAIAVVTTVIGAFFLYKGLSIDDRLDGLSGTVQEAFYSGRVSLVTYVVGTGLALVGLFVGAITVSEMDIGLRMVVQFIFTSIPWLALAAFVASTGRLFDELLNNDYIRSAFLNVPFAVIAVGLVIRGFAAFFLENAGVIEPLIIPSTTIGPLSIPSIRLLNSTRLIVFVVAGILISLLGIAFSSHISDVIVEGEVTEESS